MGARGRRSGIDALRVPAAFALLVAHGAYWLAPFRIGDPVWMLLGYLGIEVFVVACGFLLGLQLFGADREAHATSASRNGVHFLVHRAKRLLPLYWLFLAINLVLAPALGEPWPDLLRYATLTQNLITPHPHFFAEAWVLPLVAWFSVLAVVLCRLLRPAQPLRGLIWLIGIIVVLHLPRVVLVTTSDPAWDEGVRKIVVMRLDAPFHGVLAAWIVCCGWTNKRHLLALAGALGLLASAWLFLTVPLDQSVSARIGLFTLGSASCAALLPWLGDAVVPRRIAVAATWVAASAYVGLLSHMTLLRLLMIAGVPMTAHTRSGGLLALCAYALGAAAVALMLRWGVERWRLAIWNHTARGREA